MTETMTIRHADDADLTTMWVNPWPVSVWVLQEALIAVHEKIDRLEKRRRLSFEEESDLSRLKKARRYLEHVRDQAFADGGRPPANWLAP